MKLILGDLIIEGTPEELATYEALNEDFAKVDSCKDACCQTLELATVEPKVTQQRELQEGDLITINFSEWAVEGITDDLSEGKRYKIVYNDDIKKLGFYDDVDGFRYSPLEYRGTYNIVTEAEQTAEPSDKWAKLGRKVNEYKKGDIVRVIDELCTDHLTKGQLVKVAVDETQEDAGIEVETIDKGNRYAVVELVAPVEAVLS